MKKKYEWSKLFDIFFIINASSDIVWVTQNFFRKYYTLVIDFATLYFKVSRRLWSCHFDYCQKSIVKTWSTQYNTYMCTQKVLAKVKSAYNDRLPACHFDNLHTPKRLNVCRVSEIGLFVTQKSTTQLGKLDRIFSNTICLYMIQYC